MCSRIAVAFLCFTFVSAAAQTGVKASQTRHPRFFPYEIQTKKLDNGLQVIVVPTPEFKNAVTYSTVVLAGSRNETEKGKTGLAHLFEHIMFRHEFGGKPGGYEAETDRLGVYNNAWTDYDLTYYHPTTFSANLIGPIQRPDGPVTPLIELEASRFKNLTLDRKTFEVEAGAVLGEYRRIFSDPSEKMLEQLSPVAYPHHPYGHTVIGYVEDVENMPNAWDAAWEFYRNYYAPNDVAIIVVGDVKPADIFAAVQKWYGDWKPSHPPEIPPEQPPPGPKSLHVKWDADVSPILMVGYHAPAMHPGSKETAVTMIMPELLVSRSAPLYQKLRYQKQTVTSFTVYPGGGSFPGTGEVLQSTDPHLMLLTSELVLDRFRKQGQSYVLDVQSDMINGAEAQKRFSQSPRAAQTLEVVKSKIRNDFLAELDSTDNIAEHLAWYYRFNRDPYVFESLMQAIDSLTPKDIDEYAIKYFRSEDQIVTTLWHDLPPAKPSAKGVK
jgi:zinc protease